MYVAGIEPYRYISRPILAYHQYRNIQCVGKYAQRNIGLQFMILIIIN